MRQRFSPVIPTKTFGSRITIGRMGIRLTESLGKPLNGNFPKIYFYKVKKIPLNKSQNKHFYKCYE